MPARPTSAGILGAAVAMSIRDLRGVRRRALRQLDDRHSRALHSERAPQERPWAQAPVQRRPQPGAAPGQARQARHLHAPTDQTGARHASARRRRLAPNGSIRRWRAAGARDDLPVEHGVPSIFAYVLWIDHTRTDLAYYPGRHEPPSAVDRGPMMASRRSATGCSPPSTAPSRTSTPMAVRRSTATPTSR
jgi:hypothetical protein